METISDPSAQECLVGRVLFCSVVNGVTIAGVECIPCHTLKYVVFPRKAPVLEVGSVCGISVDDACANRISPSFFMGAEIDTCGLDILQALYTVRVPTSKYSEFVRDEEYFNADEIASICSELSRPRGVVRRDNLMHRPFNICGKLWNLHLRESDEHLVWVELLGKSQSTGKGDVIYIFCSPDSNFLSSSLCEKACRGDRILFRNIYPIYLWGRLHGFAMTVRSSYKVIQDAPHGRRRCVMKVQPSSITACATFNAWHAYLLRRLQQCVRGAKKTKQSYNPLVWACCASILSQLPSSTMAVFERPSNISTLREFCDSDVGPLFVVRGGHDIDWLCSLLPEVWSCAMLCQFAENAAIQHGRASFPRFDTLNSTNLKTMSGSYKVVVECTRGSKLRYETFSCTHDVLVIGSLVDYHCSCVGDVQCIVLGDSLGTMLPVLIVHSSCTDEHDSTVEWGALCQLLGTLQNKKSSPISRQNGTALPLATTMDVVVCLKNPTVFVEIHPEYSAESSQIYAIVTRRHISVLSHIPLVGRDVTAEEPPSTKCPSSADITDDAASAFALAQFLYRHLVQVDTVEGTVSCDSTDVTSTSVINTSQVPLSVRQVLMTDLTSQEDNSRCSPAYISVTGVVVRRDRLSSDYSGSGSSHRQKKRAKIDPNQAVVLRDESSPDAIVLYMPTSFARVCTPGFVIKVAGVELKISSNRRKTYMVSTANSNFGIVGIRPLDQIENTIRPFAHIPIFKLDDALIPSLDSGNCSVPVCSLVDLLQSCHRDRCLWKFPGQITLIKEVEVFVRCRSCYTKAEFMRQGCSDVLCCRKHPVLGEAHSTRQFSSNCELWWSGTIAVEDGTYEANIYIEGMPLRNLLEKCYKAPGNMSGSKRDHQISTSPHTEAVQDFRSFAEFRTTIESIVSRVGAVKYSHFSSSRQYSPLEDSLDTHSTDDDMIAAMQMRSGQSICHSLTGSMAGGNSDAKVMGSAYIARFLKRCSLCTWMQYYVKAIASRYHHNPNTTIATRKIKVQRVGTPRYIVDNVEYVSESCAVLLLECIHCSVLSSREVAIHAWNIMNSLKHK